MTIKYLTPKRWQYPYLIQPAIFVVLIIGSWTSGRGSQVWGQTWSPQTQETLKKPIAIFWNEVPLRSALNNLSATQGIPMFLDRRVDPGQPISIETQDTSVGEVIYQLAEESGCGVAWLGDLAYLGPPTQVSNLQILRSQLMDICRKLPRGLNRQWLKGSAFEIPDLGQPGHLLERVLESLGAAEMETAVPHDLWSGGQYGSVRPIDQVILLTFGFDLWPKFNSSGELTIGPAPSPQEGKTKIRINKSEREQIGAMVRKEYPAVKLSPAGRDLVMEGPPEDLHELRSAVLRTRWQTKPEMPLASSGEKVVSGRIKGSIGQALNTAAKGLSLELSFEPHLRPKLLQQIDINVRGVTYRELADRVVKGTGLAVLVRSGELVVFER